VWVTAADQAYACVGHSVQDDALALNLIKESAVQVCGDLRNGVVFNDTPTVCVVVPQPLI
jgi:hypothetical protein